MFNTNRLFVLLLVIGTLTLFAFTGISSVNGHTQLAGIAAPHIPGGSIVSNSETASSVGDDTQLAGIAAPHIPGGSIVSSSETASSVGDDTQLAGNIAAPYVPGG